MPSDHETAREQRVEALAKVLATHRVNYHHRNVGPEPVTATNLRYTSCEGCDWLGGHRDEAGWEAHLAEMLTDSPAMRDLLAEAKAEAWDEGYDQALDDTSKWHDGDADHDPTANPYRETSKEQTDD